MVCKLRLYVRDVEIYGVIMYGFVYLTTNNINGKKYIGQRKYDKEEKWKDYLGSGIILSRAIDKYGRENFSKEIIEECETKATLNDREMYWIEYYDAVNSDDFYNIAKGGDGGDTTAGYSEEQKIVHSNNKSKALKGKINQGANNPSAKQVICLNNMMIFDTTVEAAKYANVKDYMIQFCCRGNTYYAGVDPITKEKLQWEYYYPDKEYRLKTISRKNNHPNIKKVICYTTQEVFNSAKEAGERYQLSQSGIRECCNFHYSSYGQLEDGTRLQWFYYDYYVSDDFDIEKHKIKPKRCKDKSKNQYSNTNVA